MFPIERATGDLFLHLLGRPDADGRRPRDPRARRSSTATTSDTREGADQGREQGGGEDNITVVAFDIADDDATPSRRRSRGARAGPRSSPTTRTRSPRRTAIPVVDTMVVSADEIAAAYEQQESQKPPKRRRLTRVLSFLVVVALLVGVAFLILWGLAR
jgi:hypothetical protein